MNKILNWRQVCEALSISRPTLNSLINQGLLKRVTVSKGCVNWLQSNVEKFVENLKTTNLNITLQDIIINN